MSEAEQEKHLGDLLVQEYKLKKLLACLESKLRQAKYEWQSVFTIMESRNANFSLALDSHGKASAVDVASIISRIEKGRDMLKAVQEDISKIGNPHQ